MGPEFYTFGIEKEICDEIKKWSETVVEKPNPYFNNLPSCPYARQAWKTNKVSFLFKKDGGFQDLYTVVSSFNDELDLADQLNYSVGESAKRARAPTSGY